MQKEFQRKSKHASIFFLYKEFQGKSNELMMIFNSLKLTFLNRLKKLKIQGTGNDQVTQLQQSVHSQVTLKVASKLRLDHGYSKEYR